MATYNARISSKGQVVIPSELREQYGLQKGTPATWKDENGRFVLTPITKRRIREIMGSFKPKPGEPSMFEESLAERERERERERRQQRP